VKPTTRRVPICTINWCCPFRSDLCRERCTFGERVPADTRLVVYGDIAFIRCGDRVERVRLPEPTKEGFRRFDRGDPEAGGENVFEVPEEIFRG
jgi:hypothetical protein